MQRTKVFLGLGGKSSSMDLKTEVKRLMFSADKEKEPVVVTTDPGKFTMVMSAFTTYEKQVCTRTVYCALILCMRKYAYIRIPIRCHVHMIMIIIKGRGKTRYFPIT